jgi:hypothetical protein
MQLPFVIVVFFNGIVDEKSTYVIHYIYIPLMDEN